MGAVTFNINGKGKSAKEAYSKLVEQADFEHGHDPYNGSINTTSGFIDKTSTFKSSGKSLKKFIEERIDKLSKHDPAECICIKDPSLNTNKIKSQVEHFVEPGAKKWLLKYVAISADHVIGTYDKKGDAVKAAREFTERTTFSSRVEIKKVLEKGNYLTARISYKQSSKEKEGTWVFYGWASY